MMNYISNVHFRYVACQIIAIYKVLLIMNIYGHNGKKLICTGGKLSHCIRIEGKV